MISGHSRGLYGLLFGFRSARNLNRLGHVQLVTLVILPARLVDPETARNAQNTKPHVGGKEFVIGTHEQAKHQEQDANHHPVLGNSSIEIIGYEHGPEYGGDNRACLLADPQVRSSVLICA